MNHKKRTLLISGIILLVGILLLSALFFYPHEQQRTVVVYTSVDQVFSEPIFRSFENQTGIKVLPVYDVEADKTTGLVNRLLAEKTNPQADVFWSAEFVQTLLLKNESVLAPYSSPSAYDIPAKYRDPDNYWAGFGGRARVFIVNTDRLSPDNYPHSIYDMLDSRYPGKSIGIAYPIFGTMATQSAALYSVLGQDKARLLLTDLNKRGIRTVDGNSVVRDLVSSGQLDFGLTDSDDACNAIQMGSHVTIILPDQKEGEMGTLIIPSTIALIAGAHHIEEGKAFIDFVLDPNTETSLVTAGWIQLPSRNISVHSPCIGNTEIHGMAVNYTDIYPGLERTKQDLTEIFVR